MASKRDIMLLVYGSTIDEELSDEQLIEKLGKRSVWIQCHSTSHICRDYDENGKLISQRNIIDCHREYYLSKDIDCKIKYTDESSADLYIKICFK